MKIQIVTINWSNGDETNFRHAPEFVADADTPRRIDEIIAQNGHCDAKWTSAVMVAVPE